MPELPEVESYRRYFERHALGQRVARVEVRDERILTVRKEKFVRALRGRTFVSVRRHGKHLFAVATPATQQPSNRATQQPSNSTQQPSNPATQQPPFHLHLHFGMTGDLAYYRDRDSEPRFAKIVFAFDGGAFLAFEDMRLFGRAGLVESPDEFIEEHHLGPDPLDPKFTFARFAALLEKRRGAVKALLMSQEIIAGLGNLYVDEILFATSIHPRRAVDRLKPAEERAIFTTMRRILRESIGRLQRDADWPSRYLTPHRETGERCPRCGGTIRRSVVFGRTTYFCAKHQR